VTASKPVPRRSRAPISRGLVTAALTLGLANPVGATVNVKRILFFVGALDQQAAGAIEYGVRAAVHGGMGSDIEYDRESIEALRFPVYQNWVITEYFRAKYDGQRFDLLIGVVDNLSVEIINTIRDDVFPGTPVVLAANSGIRRAENATGLVVRSDLARTFRLATALQPDLRQAFIITDAVVAGDAVESRARQELGVLASSLTFTLLTGLSTEDIEQRVAHLPPHSCIYFASFPSEGPSRFLPGHVLDRVARIANAPVYTSFDADIGRGVVGGSVPRWAGRSDALGGLALRVLRGEQPDRIPVSEDLVSVNVVDWRQLRRWNIDLGRVPAGTAIMFREPTLSESHPRYLAGATWLVPAIAALVLASLRVQRKRRRQAHDAALLSSRMRVGNLGGRLIRAQEEERRSVARELHDDIGQQVALLSIDLDLLVTHTPNGDVVSDPHAHNARDRAEALARTVHDLSHRMHPSALELLGLLPALEGLRRELSRKNVVIHLRHGDVPRTLPPAITLCVFRVVQEGLNNAIAHSGGREVWVHLTAGPGALAVSIADRGAGFVVEAGWNRGLGLRSLRERLELIGGTLNVISAPGAGTRVEATVPLIPDVDAIGEASSRQLSAAPVSACADLA
jgi:signal transduction histidine kinase